MMRPGCRGDGVLLLAPAATACSGVLEADADLNLGEIWLKP
jgi:hypothetical protein